MKTSIFLATAGLLFVSSTALSGRVLGGEQSDKVAVQAATAEFYGALNAMFKGDLEPMKAAWSHADDITYLGPDGKVNVGWKQTLADFQKQADMKLGGAVHHEQIMLNVGKELAVMECREVGENMIDGKPVKVSLRATNVFRKENGKWKMIGHHTDKLPFLE